jgi:4-diphosphocytidyl-2-C-methyl-D-erythritol kinase
VSRLLAPAKLTLTLAVTGVRADGYHELRSEMVSLSLADELTFTPGGRGLTLVAEPGTRADMLGDERDNLITRALAATGRQAAVHVRKRIPLGGGLGGGSTDAAAVLRWAGCTDPDVARSLGSDVPFSVAGGRALVEGTGETVTPLAFEARTYLLVLPPFGVDTARVYAAWDARGGREDLENRANALTTAALTVEPRLAVWRDALRDIAGGEPRLAGSGSTWFVEVTAADGRAADSSEEDPVWLTRGDERARLIAAHTVPVGWDGS